MAPISCGNTIAYDSSRPPGCMPVCDACLQKWFDHLDCMGTARAPARVNALPPANTTPKEGA